MVYAFAMIHDAANPAEYLDALEADWRKERLLVIRDIFLAVPGVAEGMKYKMLGYDVGDKGLGVLNAQKGYVSVYMDPLTALDPDGTLLAGMDYGRSCLRVKKRTDMDKVAALVRNRISLVLDGTL